MNDILKCFLFSRQILVSEDGVSCDTWAETLSALTYYFGIGITSGAALAQPQMIRLAQRMLGEKVPEPFYRGFPATVRDLTEDQLLFDKLVHYLRTYTLGDFSRPGHSILEFDPDMGGRELIQAVLRELGGPDTGVEKLLAPGPSARKALSEAGERRRFAILTEAAAQAYLKECVDGCMLSTRPLSEDQLGMVSAYLRDYGYAPRVCACKDTAIALLLQTRDLAWGRFLRLSDAVDVAEAMAWRGTESVRKWMSDKRIKEWRREYRGARKLNLPNRDRKLLKQLIDAKFIEGNADTRECFTRQALWCGLLHHIHYKPVNAVAEAFVKDIRCGRNRSAESEFERALAAEGPARAARRLRDSRGPGAVLRRLDYLLSRCRDDQGGIRGDEADAVIECARTDNVLLLIQLLMRYACDQGGALRTFRFTKHNMLYVHDETLKEGQRRRSALPAELYQRASDRIRGYLRETLAGRLGRVYIDPDMRRMMLPLQETASMDGLGAMPRGSRAPLEPGKTVRCFVHWEKVFDIDLAAIGLTEAGDQEEFSWRTFGEPGYFDAGENVWSTIVFSGDETSGYQGGSEYFDVDPARFRALFPNLRYLVFCANIFTDNYGYDDCECRAGYMLRQEVDSGEIYEPKTVASAFRLHGRGRFAYLFAIDLERSEIVWLNILRASDDAVAGGTSLLFLLAPLRAALVFNVYDFFSMMATELVDDPAQAEVIVSDGEVAVPEGAVLIRSRDREKMLAYLNGGRADGWH